MTPGTPSEPGAENGRIRVRLPGSLSASASWQVIFLLLSLAVASCSSGRDEEGAVKCPSGVPETTCVPPGEIVQGSKLPATFDKNRCQLREEVKNSCCKPAIAGPTFKDGKCCYVFCAGSCC
jgi:hypothetical protein